MKQLLLKRWILTVLLVLGISIVLSGPAATWLQCRGMQAGIDAPADVVYMLAGERDQDRRVDAVRRLVGARPGHSAALLTGNDRALGRFDRAAGRNLTVGEWAVYKLQQGNVNAALLSGSFNGTDGEMLTLAAWLAEHPAVRRVTLVTSPFHARRCVRRLAAHLRSRVEISICLPPGEWRDRAPWTVLAELAKMARDAAGLESTPLLTRRGWGRSGALEAR